MVKKKLVEGLVEDGARLLKELDRKDFRVESMFWAHLSDEDYWRLIIASPVVSDQGSGAGYQILNEVLEKLQLAGLSLEDISLVAPDSPQFRNLLSLAAASGRLATGPEWIEFEDAIVYRWTDVCIRATLDCDASAEELTRFWNAERQRANLPALLISSSGPRITLRFHPQHGVIEGIENLKQAFQIALHRPDARPHCKVKWET
jgi:hypothetical protein